MPIDKSKYHNTIFGKEYEVIVYDDESQHIDHISIKVHPSKVEEIRKLIEDPNLIKNAT